MNRKSPNFEKKKLFEPTIPAGHKFVKNVREIAIQDKESYLRLCSVCSGKNIGAFPKVCT